MKKRKPRVIWVVCHKETKRPTRCTPMSVYAIDVEPPADPYILSNEEYVKFIEVIDGK